MKITMAHGSGGKTSSELMADVFAKHFSNEVLAKMEDAAVLSVTGKIAISTDSFVVDPILFKGGDIGKLAICGTVNDLLMMGASPKYLTCGFILQEGLDIDTLERIVSSMAEEAKKAGVIIVAGDTKVVEGNGGLFINTTGVGILSEERETSASFCKPGDAVLLSGTLGDHHACILSARMNLANEIKSDCACLSEITEALFKNGIHVHTMRDVTRGGLGTILNEIADTSGCMISIKEENLPVSEEVLAFTEILGLDPIYMGNEGKMIAIVPGEEAEAALALMRATDVGKDAVLLGYAKEGSGVQLITRLGGTRSVDVLYGEGLPRIC